MQEEVKERDGSTLTSRFSDLAKLAKSKTFDDTSTQVDEDLFALNVFSVVNLTRVVLPHMLQRWNFVPFSLSSNCVFMCKFESFCFLLSWGFLLSHFPILGVVLIVSSLFHFKVSRCLIFPLSGVPVALH